MVVDCSTAAAWVAAGVLAGDTVAVGVEEGIAFFDRRETRPAAERAAGSDSGSTVVVEKMSEPVRRRFRIEDMQLVPAADCNRTQMSNKPLQII